MSLNILPAIDLYAGKAVRLLRGDYQQMTVYSDDPPAFARQFAADGAEYLHAVDLEGARDGSTANFETVKRLVAESGLRTEIGGGVRSEAVIEKYLNAGVWRVILGTAALTQPGFVREMAARYGDRVAVGVDARDGFVAIKGWTEVSQKNCFDFCAELEADGVTGVICTDISRDGAMRGTNLAFYRELTARTGLKIVASGGVSSLEDVRALKDIGVWGAILGKALYTGAVDLKQALAAAKEADA